MDRFRDSLRLSRRRQVYFCCLVLMHLSWNVLALCAESPELLRAQADRKHAEGLQFVEKNEPAQALTRFSEAFLIRHQQFGPIHSNTLMSLQRAYESGEQVNKSSRETWTHCLPWLEKVRTVCTNSYRRSKNQDIRAHTERILNLLTAAYWKTGDEKRGKESLAEVSRWKLDSEGSQVSSAEFEAYRLGMEKLEREMSQSAAAHREQFARSTLRAQQDAIAKNPVLQLALQQLASNGTNSISSSGLMKAYTDDPSLLATAEYADYMRTNMNGSYSRMRDGQNHVAELNERFARDHPDAAKIIQELASKRAPDLLGGMTPGEWVEFQLRKWNQMLVGVGGQLGPQIKQIMSPFDHLPQEVQSDSGLMAQMILGLKGTLLESDLRMQRAKNSDDPKVRELGKKLAAVQQRFDQMDSTTGVSPGSNQLAAYVELQNRENSLKKELRTLPGFMSPEHAPTTEVIAALPPGTALVEYLRYGSFNPVANRIEARYGALLLLPGKKPLWLPLTNATIIDPLVDQYQDWMRRSQKDAPGDAETKSLLSRLHETVWAPVEKAFSERPNRVLLSPDGALNFLSFATLINPDGRFLAEDFAISYVSSGRDILIKPTSTRSGNRRMEIWADPNFGPVSGSQRTWSEKLGDFQSWLYSWWETKPSGLTIKSFNPLRGTREEAKALQNIAASMKWDVKLHMGDEATEEAFRKMQPPRVLHLATHGFFIATPRSTNVFGDALMAKPSVAGRVDPLYLSGVALQGADRTASAWSKDKTSSSANDGLLMAAEVTRLDLTGTWLACLSACESGIGQAADAESIRGLRTAFHVAGADHVLSSLWKVDDSYAATFMGAFYEDGLKTEDIAGALARLQAKEFKNVSRGGLWRRVTRAGPFMMSSVGTR